MSLENYTPQQIEEILQAFFDIAGTRQYIGARYVPLFGRRGETSIEWDNSAPYEPLTIVLYQGNSYTSRTYVPSGAQIDDEEYWALTGAYNSQVEAYRREVIQLQEDWTDWKSDTIDDLNDWKDDTIGYIDQQLAAIPRIAVYIGNSYTLGVGSTSGTDGLFAKTKHLFNEAYEYIVGGNGFAAYTGHSTTFYSQLQSAAADTQFANDLVTDIIFVSAMGDTRAICEGHEATMITSIQNCKAYIKNNFPNATMHVCFAEMVYGRNTQVSYSDFYYMAQMRVHYVFNRICTLNGINYMGWLGWYPNNMSGYNDTDNYHPNDDGYAFLEGAFLNAWFGVTPYNFTKSFSLVDASSNAVFTFTATEPGECDVNAYRMSKSLLPASIQQLQVYDIDLPIVGPSYLPPFVPYIPVENPLVFMSRFSDDTMVMGFIRLNGTLDSASDRTKDLYARIAFLDDVDNTGQTGTMFMSGTHHVRYHVKRNFLQLEAE